MANRLGHLELPLFPESCERQKRPVNVQTTPRSEEDKGKYFDLQIQHLTNIKESYERSKVRYSEFLDPNLIFKLEIIQPVNEETLRQELNRMDIAVLAPAPQKKGGLWVVFAEDEEAVKFQKKLKLYAEQDRYEFFSALGELVEIPVEDKIGERLSERMLESDEIAYLDVEIWRMEDDRLKMFLSGLDRLISSKGGRITDKLIKQSFCLLRIQASAEIVNGILPLREIAIVDRPPKPYIRYDMLNVPLDAVSIGPPPPADAIAIAVLDSGIFSGHPLLRNAIGDEIAIGTWNSNGIHDGKPVDDVGHGTKVAGIALYGDLKACIESGEFRPEIWILSAKVMYGVENPVTGKIEAKYDEEELLEHQLEEAVKRLSDAYPNCKVFNLSFGDEYKCMFGDKRQFNLAALVDDLSKELGVIFVISAGNLSDYSSRGFPDDYPTYLLEETEDIKIVDPASAALAITVGSITQEYGPSDRSPMDILFSPADTGYPSPFTRVGPGYKGIFTWQDLTIASYSTPSVLASASRPASSRAAMYASIVEPAESMTFGLGTSSRITTPVTARLPEWTTRISCTCSTQKCSRSNRLSWLCSSRSSLTMTRNCASDTALPSPRMRMAMRWRLLSRQVSVSAWPIPNCPSASNFCASGTSLSNDRRALTSRSLTPATSATFSTDQPKRSMRD